jgi:hypothetical protein
MAGKGESWNESEVYLDPVSLREVRRITSMGHYNTTPTYHTNTGFTADGEYLIFASARHARSAIFRCEVSTGDITQLIDWVDGVGSRMNWSRGFPHSLGDGKGVASEMTIAPKSKWAIYVLDRSLRAVQLESLEERILIADVGCENTAGIPSVDPSETHVVLPIVPVHPKLISGERITNVGRGYMDGPIFSRLVQVPLAGGEVETIYEEEGIFCAHCPHCPTDPDLIMIDRTRPSATAHEASRVWTLRPSSGELTELRPRDEYPRQTHAAWTWDGEAVVYHGRSGKGGWYIGIIDRGGEVIQEYNFMDAEYYGHVTAMAGRPAIIVDGNVTNNMLLWLYYEKESPRFEVIGRHDTDWQSMPYQYPHPHPLSDPTGRWMSFNAARRDKWVERSRSDVYILSL